MLTLHLNTLIKLLVMSTKDRRKELLSIIRKETTAPGAARPTGGDFYLPFWADAKAHMAGTAELPGSVRSRIDRNSRRRNLYPRLQDGFLGWWNEKRRWINDPHELAGPVKARFVLQDIGLTIKVEGAVKINVRDRFDRVIYPYFAPDHPIVDPGARLALWVLTKVLPDTKPDEFRILDVFAARSFGIGDAPPLGDEEEVFNTKYAAMKTEMDEIRDSRR
jgi:hypothetical protein